MTDRNTIDRGFTLIELLVAFSIVAVISSYAYGVLNGPAKQRQANEAVASENISKLANSIATLRTAEGSYPANSTDAIVATYVTSWPNGSPAGYTYTYGRIGSATTGSFVIVATNPLYTGCIKFSSTWTTGPRSCTNCATSSTAC